MITDTTYPSFTQDPATGERDFGRIDCLKCRYYGDIENFGYTRPCTICAMDNGGKWGWEEGHFGEKEFLQEENGSLPGHCGVIDALNQVGLSAGEIDDSGITFHHLKRTLNEQIILGFSQYAVYNHLKWSDIIDVSQEENISDLAYFSKYQQIAPVGMNNPWRRTTETDKTWYWWKRIPKGVVLPERLLRKLIQILVEYPDAQHDGCVPKTRQRLSEPLSDDIWTDFFATYVEPAQVAHIFMHTMKKVLEYDDEVEHGLLTLSQEDTIENFGRDDYRWAVDHGILLSVQFMFYKQINHDVPEDHPMRKKMKVIKILDRDVFGCYLDDVIDYDWGMERSWNRRTDIFYPTPNIIDANGEDRRPVGWQIELWNPSIAALQESIWTSTDIVVARRNYEEDTIMNLLAIDVQELIAYESTEVWEDIQRVSDDHIDSDYTNEECFRSYLDSIECEWPPGVRNTEEDDTPSEDVTANSLNPRRLDFGEDDEENEQNEETTTAQRGVGLIGNYGETDSEEEELRASAMRAARNEETTTAQRRVGLIGNYGETDSEEEELRASAMRAARNEETTTAQRRVGLIGNYGETDDEDNYTGEYESGEIEENTNASDQKLKDVVEKLKELQEYVDHSVRDIVPEGVYLKVVDMTLDVYKCV